MALTTAPARLSGSQFYTNWAAARFSDIPEQSGPLADPDLDGERNLVEFVSAPIRARPAAFAAH